MKRLAFRKSTGKVIPDFQGLPLAQTLIDNAVRQGIPLADIEVRDVDDATYATLEEAAYGAIRAQSEVDRQAALAAARTAVSNKLANITDAQLRALKLVLDSL